MEMCKTVSQNCYSKTQFFKKKLAVIFAIFHANVQIFSKVVVFYHSITILHIVIIFGYLPHCQHKDICIVWNWQTLGLLQMWKNSFWWFSKCCKYKLVFAVAGVKAKLPKHQFTRWNDYWRLAKEIWVTRSHGATHCSCLKTFFPELLHPRSS